MGQPLPSSPSHDSPCSHDSSWAEHLEAALAMGLTQREALETFGGFHGMVRASRERIAAMESALDQGGLRSITAEDAES